MIQKNYRHGTRSKRIGIGYDKDKEKGARDKGQGSRDKEQRTRDKRQGTCE